jgi:hypothetical protein
MADGMPADVASGSIGRWPWVEMRGSNIRCAAVIADLRPWFLGLRGACTSWDSGRLDPAAEVLAGWELRGGQACSPVVDDVLAESWPYSSCGFDEWYFFAALPELEPLGAYSSWGTSLDRVAGLKDVPSGLDLEKQLDTWRPRVVIGDGYRVFAISQDRQLLDEFAEWCRRRRTRG